MQSVSKKVYPKVHFLGHIDTYESEPNKIWLGKNFRSLKLGDSSKSDFYANVRYYFSFLDGEYYTIEIVEKAPNGKFYTLGTYQYDEIVRSNIFNGRMLHKVKPRIDDWVRRCRKTTNYVINRYI